MTVTKKLVCRVEECPRDGLKAFEVDGDLRVLITCHRHLWQWDVRTGEALGQAEAPLLRYEISEEDGVLYMIGSAARAPGAQA